MKDMTTPLICGTVVRDLNTESKKMKDDKAINNMTFHRKLRMMRADVFALLSISTNSDFVQKVDDSQCIKKWTNKFLEGEFNDRV